MKSLCVVSFCGVLLAAPAVSFAAGAPAATLARQAVHRGTLLEKAMGVFMRKAVVQPARAMARASSHQLETHIDSLIAQHTQLETQARALHQEGAALREQAASLRQNGQLELKRGRLVSSFGKVADKLRFWDRTGKEGKLLASGRQTLAAGESKVTDSQQLEAAAAHKEEQARQARSAATHYLTQAAVAQTMNAGLANFGRHE